MKKLITLLLVLVTLNGYTQPIDYNNFDSKRAEEVLFETFQHFRDTIQYYVTGKIISEKLKDIPNYNEKRKLYWSDRVYNLISKPNTEENVRQNRLHHVDRVDWWYDLKNKKPFSEDVYIKYDTGFDIPDNLHYMENGLISYKKFDTYQEMASHMIKVWESSPMHKGTQRSNLFDTYEYRTWGDDKVTMKSQVACCVRYSHGKHWAFINFIY
tara:strand:+ start:38 stop:673 length:636 start_codon:yes stop_codon:yes gene_type:complete